MCSSAESIASERTVFVYVFPYMCGSNGSNSRLFLGVHKLPTKSVSEWLLKAFPLVQKYNVCCDVLHSSLMSNSLWGVVIPYWHLAGMIGWLTAGLAELADRAGGCCGVTDLGISVQIGEW